MDHGGGVLESGSETKPWILIYNNAELGEAGTSQSLGLIDDFMPHDDARRPPHADSDALESLDYSVIENQLFIQKASTETDSQRLVHHILHWILMLVLGILIGLTQVGLDLAVRWVQGVRLNLVLSFCDDQWNILVPMFVSVVTGVLLAGLASSAVLWLEPAAGGAGISEMKCYLNGIKIPNFFCLSTFVIKFLGTVCTVASGLPSGPEAPMVHLGAIVAAGVPQGKSTTLPFVDLGRSFVRFRNDRDKRDFVSAGVAAGMATAMSAPVGGVLFSLEEGASFWKPTIALQIFTCSIVAVTVANFIRIAAITGSWRYITLHGLFTAQCSDERQAFYFYDLMALAYVGLVGILGGIAGAASNSISQALFRFRKPIRSRWVRLLSSMALVALTNVLSILMTRYIGKCHPIKSTPSNDVHHATHQGPFCKPGEEYNDMALLFMSAQNVAISNLLESSIAISNIGLTSFGFVYLILSVAAFGLDVPYGAFLPTLLNGAAFGRLFTNLLGKPQYRSIITVAAAAATLGGKTRMTVSLTTILMESTCTILYALPIFIAVALAKSVASRFNPSIYDTFIKLKGYPYLHPEPPSRLYRLQARHIMSPNVVTLPPNPTIRKTLSVLCETTHNAFPVIDADQKILGTILRHQLITMTEAIAHGNSTLTEDDFARNYPGHRSASYVQNALLQHNLNVTINLHPYVCKAFVLVPQDISMGRLYSIFKVLQLRHLLVVSHNRMLVGMVTRKDLMKY